MNNTKAYAANNATSPLIAATIAWHRAHPRGYAG